MQRLEGKKALITGGTTGIGFATAERFLAEGAEVAITGQNPERLAKAASRLGSNVLPIRADATDMAAVRAIADELRSAWGELDIAFLNAGTGRFQFLPDIDEATFDSIYSVNVKAVLFGVQSLAPIMNDGGSIIVTSSVNARMGMGSSASYAASKAAASALVRVFAGELSARRIRVNSIASGGVQTTMGPKLGIPEAARPAFTRAIQESVPLSRVADASELAAVAAFLASDDASYVNATEVVVDGGWTGVMR